MQRRPALITLLLVSALAALPLFLNPGFLNTRGGGDSPFLLFRLHQLYAALTQGVFPVRWMPDAAFGLGYPFFNYYAALPLYLAAIFKFLGASYVLALKLTHLAGFVLAAIGMYGWMRSAGANRPAAWLAAAAYTFAPFHLVNVYVRGDSLNEFFAFALFPLCLWAARRLAGADTHGRADTRGGADTRSAPTVQWADTRSAPTDTQGGPYVRGLPLALAYAALALTHNISFLIFSPFLGLYIFLLALRTRSLLFIVHSSFFIALGLALSAFYWLPALRETGFAQLGPQTTGYFFYGSHFRGWNLVQPSFVFNYDVGSPDTTPFAMSLAQAALAALGLLVLAVRLAQALRRRDSWSIVHCSFVILGFAISSLMITRFSEPLWANLPLLPFVQFPWRFLSVQSVFASAIIGLIARPSSTGAETRNTRYSILNKTAALAILVSVPYSVLNIAGLRPDFVALADADVTPERLQTYEYFTGNIGTTIRYEYLPKWTQPRPYSSEEYIFGAASLKVLSGEAGGERTAKRAASQTWSIAVETDSAAVAVPLLYWPGWGAAVDGRPVEVRPADGLGWIAFDLPGGEHIVELTLGDTPIRRAAAAVSLLSLLAAAILARPRRLLQSPSVFSASLWLRIAGMAIALLALALLGRFLNIRAASVGAATMDFDQQGYLHSSAVVFDGGGVLQGYNYSAETLNPGDALAVALQWQAGHKAAFSLELVSPAGHLLQLPRTYAQAGGAAEGQAGVLLRIPDDLPTGVYLLRLTLTRGDLPAPALTSNGQPRGAIYLRPIRIIRPAAPASLPPGNLTAAIALLGASASQTDSTAVTVTLNWQAAAPVPANYVLALRLRDSAGFDLASLDVQPTGGVYPTAAWRVGEIVSDVYRFDLPSGLPPGEYPLSLTLYDAATLAAAGTTTVPIGLNQWTPPPGTEPLHRFTDTLALFDVTLPSSARAGDLFTFTARWTSLAAVSQDLVARWSAVGPNGEVAAFDDQPLAAIPTSQWAAGALVRGRPHITLPITAPGGEYTINVQLLDPSGQILSPAVAVGKIAAAPSDRTTALPPMQFESGASFGPMTLAGYDASTTADSLELILYWRQTGAAATDYKYFVHLFNPEDETIAAQADGFPAILTSQWAKDEVVSVSVSLPLAELEPSAIYNIGVGWYDPDTGDRLGERVILSQGVVNR